MKAGRPLVFNLFGCDKLVERVRRHIDGIPGELTHRNFPDGESYIRVQSDVKNRDVIILTSLDDPNTKLLPLLMAAKTCTDFGCLRLGLIAPYLPYMRQDKSFEAGEAVTSRHFADLLSDEFDWLATVDPHLHRIRKLSEIYRLNPVVISAVPAIAAWIGINVDQPIIIGPDGESNQWASAIAHELSVPFIVAQKDRCGDRCVDVDLPALKSDNGKTPVIVDDIISTAGTMIETVITLKQAGLPAPVCIGIHALLNESVERTLRETGAVKITTCNTILHATNAIDVSELIAKKVATFVQKPFQKPFRRLV